MLKPYLPTVTFQEVLDYRPEDPNTHTRSPLVNAVSEVLYVTTIRECKAVAHVLQLDLRTLRDAMKMETGMPFKELIVRYRLYRAKQYINEHPNLSQIQMARDCGFSSYHAMWRFLQNTLGETPLGEKSNAQ